MTRRRIFSLVVLAGAIPIVALLSFKGLRERVLPWTVNRALEATILRWPPWAFSIETVEPGTRVDLAVAGERTLPAERFGIGGTRGRILLVHGSIPKGRRFSPYRHLARTIAGRGFEVLLPDIGGYGEAKLAKGAIPTFGRDVRAATVAFRRLAGKDDDQDLVILGHSLGACMALEAIADHGVRPRGLVVWDPPVDVTETLDSSGRERFLRRMRSELQAEGGAPTDAIDDALDAYFRSIDVFKLLDRLPAPQPRTLCALGALIPDHTPFVTRGQAWYAWFTILDLTDVDHFLNMVSIGDNTMVHRPGNEKLFLDALSRWLE